MSDPKLVYTDGDGNEHEIVLQSRAFSTGSRGWGAYGLKLTIDGEECRGQVQFVVSGSKQEANAEARSVEVQEAQALKKQEAQAKQRKVITAMLRKVNPKVTDAEIDAFLAKK